MTTSKDKINKNAEFNIINLDSSEGSFSKALEKWKRYSISDFTTPNVCSLLFRGKELRLSAKICLFRRRL